MLLLYRIDIVKRTIHIPLRAGNEPRVAYRRLSEPLYRLVRLWRLLCGFLEGGFEFSLRGVRGVDEGRGAGVVVVGIPEDGDDAATNKSTDDGGGGAA